MKSFAMYGRAASVVATITVACVMGWLTTPSASADDAVFSTSMALGDIATTEHLDAEPFKGWLDLTVYNSGLDPWGDFHLEFYQVTGPIDNVSWLVSSPYEPTSSQSGLTWAVDNVTVGATLDLYFYGDPVLPGQTANFKVYTDNPDHVSFFGVSMHPTPVPEPATAMLMLLPALLARRRR